MIFAHNAGLRRLIKMKRIKVIGSNLDTKNGNTITIECPYCKNVQIVTTYQLSCTESTECSCGAKLAHGYIAVR